MNPQLEINIIASIVSVACALPGVFLILKKMAMMSDAISHSILPGIVLAFFITNNLNSPLLIFGASLMGLFTVFLVESLNKSGRIKEDASIGVVFPLLFAIGIILITQFAGNVHLDTDAVLLGELAFAPFDRIFINGADFGPVAVYVMSLILLINLLFILLFFKELKITTFDAGLATALGFSPWIIHYSLMASVSITAVGAFNFVGVVLVVAYMIIPGLCANLITDRLALILILSAVYGVICSILGVQLAFFLAGSISGSITTVLGMAFLITYIFSPEKGILASYGRKKRLKVEFALDTLLIHLNNHMKSPERIKESGVPHLKNHLGWNEKFAKKILERGIKKDLFSIEGGIINLSKNGIGKAQERLSAIGINSLSEEERHD